MSGIGMAGVGVAGVAAALSIGLAADADCHGGQPVGAAAGAAPCDLYAATAASTVGGGMFGNESDAAGGSNETAAAAATEGAAAMAALAASAWPAAASWLGGAAEEAAAAYSPMRRVVALHNAVLCVAVLRTLRPCVRFYGWLVGSGLGIADHRGYGQTASKMWGVVPAPKVRLGTTIP